MKVIKKLDKHLIYKKNSGRFAVEDRATGKRLNAADKVAVLLEHKLIKLTPAKPKAAEPTADAAPAADAAPTA